MIKVGKVEKYIQNLTWDDIRFALKISDLKKLAKDMKINISHVPENSQKKRRIAKIIFDEIEKRKKSAKAYLDNKGTFLRLEQ